jgi:nucleoside-diphosphate-sugar epimerase
MAAVDTVFHLGAVTAARSEHEYELANATGTRAMVDAMISAESLPRRLVYLSSYAAGGPSGENGARACHAEPAPLTAYGRTKLAGEYAAREAEDRGIGVVVIRAPVVYGPGDRALLPYFRLVRWGLALAPGGEDRMLHLVYAPDLALAIRRSADAPPGTYAVAEPVVHSWEEIARVIARGMGRQPIRIPLPAPLVRTAASITEAIGRLSHRAVTFNREKAEEMLASAWIHDLAGSETLLSHQDATSLHDGIERTIRWYIRQGWL